MRIRKRFNNPKRTKMPPTMAHSYSWLEMVSRIFTLTRNRLTGLDDLVIFMFRGAKS